jgi:hypothetical protein
MPRDNTRVLRERRSDGNQYSAAERTPPREEHDETPEPRGRKAATDAGGE